MTTPAVPPDFMRRFAEDGYVVLRGILEPRVVDDARGEMSAIVDGLAAGLVADGTLPHAFRGEPLETRMARLYEGRLERAPKYFRENLHRAGLFGLFFHPALLDAAGIVLGPEIRLYPNYSARPKLPRWKGTEVLWHQDGGYTADLSPSAVAEVNALRMVNAWTPLVPARVANGCMSFVPGTHQLGLVRHEQREHYLEIAPEVLAPHLPRALPIELDPGDVVLFHNLLFHCGLPNAADTIRWSLDWRWQDARQPTQRAEHGHLARSAARPAEVVRDAADWASRTFR